MAFEVEVSGRPCRPLGLLAVKQMRLQRPGTTLIAHKQTSSPLCQRGQGLNSSSNGSPHDR